MSTDRTGWDDGHAPSRFTPNSEEAFYAVVDSPEFFRQDAKLIYQALQEQLIPISFGDYLKRYIYRKAGFTQPFELVPLAEYQSIIEESFLEQGVPASFTSSNARMKIMARNWLTQQTVSRESVLLLGFGLHMHLEDVEELLIKGLHETRLNRKNPREVLCGFCYAHGMGYHKYEDLARRCREKAGMPGTETSAGPVFPETLQDEEKLVDQVAGLMRAQSGIQPDQEARQQFALLYRQAQEVTAAAMNNMNQDTAVIQTRTSEKITPADIEQIMQAAIPRDRHGNLLPMKKSTLNRQFRNRRLTRQRLEELLSGKTQITRYDLIMLHFFVFVHQKTASQSKLVYYRRFLETTNQILAACGMGPLYTANPFECFLLMCVLSEDPMGTYADVMEKSYREAMQ